MTPCTAWRYFREGGRTVAHLRGRAECMPWAPSRVPLRLNPCRVGPWPARSFRPADGARHALVTRTGIVRYFHRDDGAIGFVRLARVSDATPLRFAAGATVGV